MLADGMVYDSARLPENAVEEHPITVSAESLMQSLASLPTQGRGLTYSGSSLVNAPGASQQSAEGHPITFSGGSIMDSEAGFAQASQSGRLSADGHPITFSGGSIMDSGAGFTPAYVQETRSGTSPCIASNASHRRLHRVVIMLYNLL